MMLTMAACDQRQGCVLDLNTKEIVDKIERIDVNTSNSVAVIDMWIDINSGLNAITNTNQRAYAITILRDSVLSMDLSKKSDYQKGCLVGEYWQILHMLGRSMLECDFPDKEVHYYLITGWSKYRDMCFSFGDENDLKGDSGRVAKMRRMQAKGMRLSYENDLGFFERKLIPLMYRGFPKQKMDEFLEVWHAKFGCRVERSDDGSRTRSQGVIAQ
jgi:hypothetical protein